MEDPAFRPKTCPIFSNASIKDARRPNRLHRGVASAWHWQKKWSKHTGDGFGLKAKPRRERLYDLSYASQNQEERHEEGCPPRLHLGSLVLSIPRWMRGMVASPTIFAALLRGGYGRGKIPASVGEKTGGARPEMCRAQFLRPCLLYARSPWALRKSR